MNCVVSYLIAPHFHGSHSPSQLFCEGPWFTNTQENGCHNRAHQSYLGTARTSEHIACISFFSSVSSAVKLKQARIANNAASRIASARLGFLNMAVDYFLYEDLIKVLLVLEIFLTPEDWVHRVGHSPVCQILYQIVAKAVITSSPPALTSSAGLLSIPADFPWHWRQSNHQSPLC